MEGAVNFGGRPAVDGLAARLGRALWPPRCLVCRERGAGGRDLCAACAAGLPWLRDGCRRCALPLGRAPGGAPSPGRPGSTGADTCGACRRRPPPLARVHAVFLYAFPIDRLLPRLKFRDDLAAGRLLADAMLAGGGPCPRPLALVPVPLARARLRRRGYDQALELARPLARALALPLRTRLLRRGRDTLAQSTLDAAARRRNLRGAFQVAPGARPPAHVALVDDVMTTGATLHAAAVALRRAGVARVDAWVCARVP